MDDYKPQQVSTYALTLYKYETKVGNQTVSVGKVQCTFYLLSISTCFSVNRTRLISLIFSKIFGTLQARTGSNLYTLLTIIKRIAL